MRPRPLPLVGVPPSGRRGPSRQLLMHQRQSAAQCFATCPVSGPPPSSPDGSKQGLGTARIQHTHVVTNHAKGIFCSYHHADAYQEALRVPFFRWKDSLPVPQSQLGRLGVGTDDTASLPAPLPRLLTFVSEPIFTLGRRQGGDAAAASSIPRHSASNHQPDVSLLLKPLSIPGCTDWQADYVELSSDGLKPDGKLDGGHDQPMKALPKVLPTNRGGLTTYHGPGQLVIWPIIDLHSPLHRHLTLRCYARLLEETTRAVLGSNYGIATHLDEAEPGVWAGPCVAPPDASKERKIAAMGVHVRRRVTALGVAINVDVSVTGAEAMNPWARFTPCGLPDRSVTNMANEMGLVMDERRRVYDDAAGRLAVEPLAAAWASEFARRLGLAGVDEEKIECLEFVGRTRSTGPTARPN